MLVKVVVHLSLITEHTAFDREGTIVCETEIAVVDLLKLHSVTPTVH